MAGLGYHDTRDNYNMTYPEPPQYAQTMDLGLSPEPYSTYPRSAHDYPTTMGYESGAVYAEAPPYMYNSGRVSPGMYPDDGDAACGPASDLSNASASSSTMGSPLSSHGQTAPIPEWAAAPHGLGLTPGIVEPSDYFPGEYSFAPGGIDVFHHNAPYDFPAASKAPGFVGELSQIPRSSHLSPHSPRGSGHARHGSLSSSASCDSGSTAVPPKHPSPGLALDTRLAQQVSVVTASSLVAPASASASSSMVSGPLLTPPTTCSSFPSSATRAVWSSPPSSRLATRFFSQSSGHFVPPLETCWFPLSQQGETSVSRDRDANMVAACADPSLIHPDVRPLAMPYDHPSYPAPPNSAYPASPALSVSASPQLRPGSTSPFMHGGNYQPYSPFQPPADSQRRGSLHSYQSNYSGEQPYSGDESREKQRCPHPDCGKAFKDLKAHMLTHQTERPEKCPITTCEYHVKGFARKYDKNRHTLTHYKGTMVCGFCPGSGSAAEKSFNRADVFKRHLTAVHGVEQTPPNSRKKAAGTSSSTSGSAKLTGYAPDATGKCSTCSQTFSNAQDFYEHLDDCVLRIVQQEDPAEAINAQRLAEVENDRDVHNTLEKNNLPTTTMTSTAEDADDEDDVMEDDEADEDSKGGRGGGKGSLASPTRKTNKGSSLNGIQKSRGLTHSRGGVPLQTKSRGRKNRRDYPSSWGFDKGQMTMKKRVLAVFDGPRRLAKDDMMLSTEHEVRLKLQDGKSYVTDLDLQTLKRAEGFLNATDEEKGPWISDDPTDEQLKQMLEYSAVRSEAQPAPTAAQ
ncbi:uncharacterized protein B0T15DRAFT_101969 [Chaetomium strumarium]|uniref:C2H2-type domain-containing protein n=1 Tax=Chaetomium strumarium TaxID=1170767 RepID=A0AAJ0M491_9PEZI|nr:hypothetical protein B0T15DRAFT_101969 [Chaetomium strumarium]